MEIRAAAFLVQSKCCTAWKSHRQNATKLTFRFSLHTRKAINKKKKLNLFLLSSSSSSSRFPLTEVIALRKVQRLSVTLHFAPRNRKWNLPKVVMMMNPKARPPAQTLPTEMNAADDDYCGVHGRAQPPPFHARELVTLRFLAVMMMISNENMFCKPVERSVSDFCVKVARDKLGP